MVIIMAKGYNDYLSLALDNQTKLQNAIASRNEQKQIYYRGRLLLNLRQAHKLNPRGSVPPSLTGGAPLNLESLINAHLVTHQNFINSAIQNNKNNVSIKKPSLTKEIALKIRRLSTKVSRVNFVNNTAQKKAMKKDIAKDSLSLAGSTLIKGPVMATAKVASAVGPLVITVAALPVTVLAALLRMTIDISNGKESKPESYNNTCVHQMTKTLRSAIKDVSKTAYESMGRI